MTKPMITLDKLTLAQLIGNQLAWAGIGHAGRAALVGSTTPPLPCPSPACPARKGGGTPPAVPVIRVIATPFMISGPKGFEAANQKPANGVGGVAHA